MDERLPAGYTDAPPPPPPEPAVDYTRLGKGRELVFLRTREIRSRSSGDQFTLHVFRDVASGRQFEMWDCAALGSRLSSIRPGTTIWLKYNGKLPTDTGREAHDFTIGVKQSAQQADDSDLPF